MAVGNSFYDLEESNWEMQFLNDAILYTNNECFFLISW